MYRILSLLLFSFSIPYALKSQILPIEGAALNYRIIGFSFPSRDHINRCKIEIATGFYNNPDSFKKNIVLTQSGRRTRIIAEVPAFGNQYTWRIVYTDNKAGTTNSSLYHFSTMALPAAVINNVRLNITKAAVKYKDAFVFLDATGILYDMNGNPVWFLRDRQLPGAGAGVVRDLKITPQKTITYDIDEVGGFEINYSGDVLWETPRRSGVSGDSVEHYHHEFTRLENGHYMALAQDFQYWKQQASPQDSLLVIIPRYKIKPGENDTACSRTPMGTLIEYDKKGSVVWSWKSSDYLDGTDIFYRGKSSNGGLMHAHENSFFFDERTKVIYLSCRNLNRIIKLKYPKGDLLCIYGGDRDKPGNARLGNGFFCGQHSCKISQKGYLYLYNNNLCNPGKPPSVLVMKEPFSEKDSLKKIWEFQCPVDAANNKGFPSGGNVIELPGNCMFVSMAYPDSKVFIVAGNKEILWSATAEKLNADASKWEPVNIYRASIILNRKDLEDLVWNSKVNK